MIDFPAVTGTQMAAVDSFMMDEIGVNTWQLMELAGYAIANVVRQESTPADLEHGITLLAGTGGNGGDAMVAARLLSGWGYACTVVLSRKRHDYRGITAHQLVVLDHLRIPVRESQEIDSLNTASFIVDGLLGFSARGNPRGEVARLIALANVTDTRVLAIDIPSGLNADTGEVGDPCIRAWHTVTLALPKTGLLIAPALIVGSLSVADIGVPPFVYQRFGVSVPADLFVRHGVIVIRSGAA